MPREIDRVRVQDMFCHAVYSATHVINQTYAPLLKPLGLTYPQYITLLILEEEDGLTVGQVSDRLKMATSTVTPLLKRLEGLGHLERRRQKDDERKVLVFLTASGRTLLRKAPALTECMIGNTMLPEDDLGHLVSLLRRLSQNLEAGAPHGEPTPAVPGRRTR